jgi:hypothetical protein
MNLLDTIAIVLQKSGEPLHPKEITRRLLKQRLWATNSKAPEVSVQTTLNRDLRLRGMDSRFQRAGPALYALREWGLPTQPADASPDPRTGGRTGRGVRSPVPGSDRRSHSH